jgi:hypothetical protein
MRYLLLGCLLCFAIGCKSMRQPLGPRTIERADDPLLSPYEQHRKVRYLYPYPDPELGPKSGSREKDLFGPHGQ